MQRLKDKKWTRKNEAADCQEKTGCNERKWDGAAKTDYFKKCERRNEIEG